MSERTNGSHEAATRLLTPADLAEVLGIPVKTLAAWRSERTGPLFLRIGVHVRYRQVDVEAWLETLVADAERWMAS